ncbi:macrophage mannose receptor 1-like [Lytechinus pictus]|uniref:macrophage mannose receptor 1-like n=1 Tax=Lytechinus pictus TaxID=7653 RepID=UPI0030B9D6AE
MGDGRSFDSAQTECASIGGRLAIIRSTEINTFLESFVTPALSSSYCYWFGLNRSSDSEPFSWNDGINLSDPHWAPDEPSSSIGQSCGCLWSDGNNDNHGRWDSRTCEDALPYICERPQIPLNGKWIEIAAVNDVQYYFSTFSANYFNANEYCRQIGGHLAQLKTSTIYSAVRDHFLRMGVNSFVFGLDDLMKEGEFRWADGTLLSETGYSQWNPGNPDNYLGNEHCVDRHVNTGAWNDRPCSIQKRFVCEKPKGRPTSIR